MLITFLEVCLRKMAFYFQTFLLLFNEIHYTYEYLFNNIVNALEYGYGLLIESRV